MFKNDTDYLDQHFLVDKEVINNFISLCNIKKDEDIVEIGPGKGVLTKELCAKARSVTAIELDESLKPFLDKLSTKYTNLNIIYGNTLEEFIPSCDKIITALPYSIVEPFVNKLIKCDFKELYMIVGLRFINNLEENNKLSLLTKSFFNTEKLGEIIPTAFEPKPRVMSGIIKMVPKKLDINDEYYVTRELFFYRDKKIKNSLKEIIIKKYNITQKESIKKIEDLHISEEILDKTFEVLSNKELDELLSKIKEL